MATCEISKEIEFDAGHRVPSHGGKCKNPHGHRYRVRVTCVGRIIDEPGRPDNGMLVDFGNLKNIMNQKVHDVLDHGFIIWENDEHLLAQMQDQGWLTIIFPYIPTAENIARWTWEVIEDVLETEFDNDLWLSEVAVWETPTSVAYYRGL